MSNYTQSVEGVQLFAHLIQRLENLPHTALAIMIENNQDLEEVKKYLLAMVNEIKGVQNAN